MLGAATGSAFPQAGTSPSSPTLTGRPISTQPDTPPAGATPDAPVPTQRASSRPTVATLPQNLSPWGMFSDADIVVKTVMVGLALASVVTWTVWLVKTVQLLAARRSGGRLLASLRGAGSLAEAARAAAGSRSAVAGLVAAAVRESDLSAGLPGEGLKERVALHLERLEAAAGRRMTRGTGLLATIGATAPFVGLFGTVWGIMNAFVGISKAQTTNLSVVAPGIAEALLATAVGLVAAIPAVVIFNVFARAIAGYRLILGDASAEILAHVSRDLDRAARPLLRAAE